LIVHFSFWTIIGGGYRLIGGWFILWPTSLGALNVYRHAWFIYPFLGFVLTLLWGVFVKKHQSQEGSMNIKSGPSY
jgi:hypothetical protein